MDIIYKTYFALDLAKSENLGTMLVQAYCFISLEEDRPIVKVFNQYGLLSMMQFKQLLKRYCISFNYASKRWFYIDYTGTT